MNNYIKPKGRKGSKENSRTGRNMKDKKYQPAIRLKLLESGQKPVSVFNWTDKGDVN